MKNTNKIILVSILFMISANIINAQKWKTGITLSPVITRYKTNIQYTNPNIFYTTKYKIGAAAGVDFYRLYGKNIMLRTGLQFNLKNYDVKTENNSGNELNFNDKEYYIILPLRLQYNLKIKEHQFFVNTGVDAFWLMQYVSTDKATNKKYTSTGIVIEPTVELFFGVGYMHKINDNFTLTINPEYSPVIFRSDYSTFRLKFSVIFNY